MNSTVDTYLEQGCGRCPLGGTPECKVHKWTQELIRLRKIALDCGLTEEVKWGYPCYTFQNKNLIMVSAFKNYCFISFFKGALLADPFKILVKQGPNTQVTRLVKFTKIEEIITKEAILKSYIYEAIEVEKSGLTIELKTNPEPIPEELEAIFLEDPVFKEAFEALTPGRQRGYILFFSAPKQSKTRVSRIEKSMAKILNGEGMHDNYRRKIK